MSDEEAAAPFDSKIGLRYVEREWWCARWRPDETERLLSLREEGYSAAQIANLLGKTTGAVVGRVKTLRRAGII